MRFVPLSEIEGPALRFVPLEQPPRPTEAPPAAGTMAGFEPVETVTPVTPQQDTGPILPPPVSLAALGTRQAEPPEPLRSPEETVTPMTERPVEAPKPTEPTPYRSRLEALDDAVNLLEEGADKTQIIQGFKRLGIQWPEIVRHGQQRGSELFRPQTVQPGQALSTEPSGRMEPFEPSLLESTANTFKRADANLKDLSTSLLFSAGALSPDDAAQLIRRQARQRGAAAPSETIQRGMEEIGSAKTYGDAAEAMLTNPRATLTLLVDSVLVTAPALAATVLTGPARPATAFATSAAMEYAAVMADVLQDKGIDLADASKVSAALQNPEILAEMKDKGAKRGLIIGTFDAITMGLAGRFMRPANELIAAGKLSGSAAKKATIAAWSKELAMQMAGGAGGEFVAQQATGENRPAEVLLEAVAEGVTAPVDVTSAVRQARASTREAQIARAIEEGVADTEFTQEGIRREGAAAAAGVRPTSIAELAATLPAPGRAEPSVGRAAPPAGRAEPSLGVEPTVAVTPEPSVAAEPTVVEGRAEPRLGPPEAPPEAAPPEPPPSPPSPPSAPPETPARVTPVTRPVAAIPGMPTGEEIEEPVTPVTPAEKPEERVTPVTPVASFTTAKGSTYEVTPDGQTIRTKRSAGKGQGETYPPHTALYVQPGDHMEILSDLQAGMGRNAVRLGYVAENKFVPIQTIAELPKDAQPIVGVFSRETGAVVNLYKAGTTPAKGLHPVEKLYTPDGQSSTHIGNQIVSVQRVTPVTLTEEVTPTEQPVTTFTPTQAAARLPETPTVAPITKPKDFEPATVNLESEGLPTVEVPLNQLSLSKDVPQFKLGATAQGVVEPLGGKFERTGVAPIQVWRRSDGSLEVISGRHRFDLAKRSGETTIPAQIHDESKGFDKVQAAILDAELNIRDGQGKVKDYVNYFKESGITKQDAESKGLLARVTGKRSYTIANQGSDELIAAVRSDQIGDEAAFYIALNAPNDARLQSVGIKAIQDGKSANTATNMMQAVKALAGETDTTLDMFGFDDSAIREAEEMAKVATQKQREIQTRLSAISGAAKNPAVAKAEGIDIRDPEAVKRRIEELNQQKAAWSNWSTSPDLVAEIRAARGVAPPAPTIVEPAGPSLFEEDLLTAPTPEDIKAKEEADARRAREAAEAERKAKADEERGDFVLTGSERAADEAAARGQQDIFAAPPAPPEYTPEQREQAEVHARETGGEIVWQRGDNALIRGYSRVTGDPVYMGTVGKLRANIDIESFSDEQIPADVKQEMIAVKQRLEAEAAEKHEASPFITFEDGLAMSKDIPEQLAGVIKEWKSLLKLDVPIYVSTIEDARENRNNFTGPHRRIGSGTLNANELGSMRMMPDFSYYILFDKSTSPTKMLETIAHEMGHVHQRLFYDRASKEEKDALRDAHKKWLESQKGKTAQEMVESMRARATGRAVRLREDMQSDELSSYWRLFSEWYADQTARWAMSSERPVTIVEKYFKRLGVQLRRFFQQLKSRKYLPDETFAQYIEKATARPADIEPTVSDRAERMAIPLANVSPTQIASTTEPSSAAESTIREEQIREYAGLRSKLARIPKKVAEGKADLGMQRTIGEMMQRARDLQVAIKLSKPRRDSAEKFLAKALTEFDNGNISADVLAVIQAAYQKNPELLEGLLLSVKTPGEGRAGTAGEFVPWQRTVRLYKGSSGVEDPITIRHELTHSLEQMMTPEQRLVVVQAWGKALSRAIKQNPDEVHQRYFNAVLEFLDKPSERTFAKARQALPSYSMYQFINPSEFWAVNAERLMDAQLGTAWDKFKRAIRKLWEGMKNVLGFDNRYAVHKTFNQIMSGSRERMGEDMLIDMVMRAGSDYVTLANIEPAKNLKEKYGRPNTPQLDTTPIKTFVTRQFKNGKQFFQDAVDNPKEAMVGSGKSVIDGLIYLRNKNVWYGSGLEARDFDQYNGALKTSEGIVTASVALDNAIRSGNIGVEVIFRGGIEYKEKLGNFVAVERDLGMKGVYQAEKELKDRIGDQLGTDTIQGYLEAKRSISIMNELYSREAALDAAKANLSLLQSMGSDPDEIAVAKDAVEGAQTDLEAIKKAASSVNMSEEEMYEFAALEQEYPELRTIMDNWTAVNQNLLKLWRQVGLLSQGRYETLAAIKDYVPWYRIMNDEEDVHSPLQSTTRTLTNIGREKLFKRGRPISIVDFRAKQGQKDFKIQPSSVVQVEVNGKAVDPAQVSVTPEGNVRLDVDLNDNDLVVFKTNREIENIIDNMTRNVMRMTMNGIRQFAANRIVLEYASRNEKGKVMVFSTVDREKGRFNWVVNGRKVVVEIPDPLVAEAIYGMDNINLKMWAPLAAVANLTRRSITLSGAFQIKQVFKDAPTAALVTGVKNPFALIGGVWKGFLTSLTNTDPVVDILKAAGIGGFHSPARTPEAEIKRRLGIMNRNVFSFVIKGLDHIGDSSDMAQRVATYKRVLAETGDETQALYQAANVINFLHHGSAGYAQAMVKVVPFMGAYLNSTDVLIRSLAGSGLKGVSRKKALARLSTTTALLTFTTLLYCMLAGADPEYDELDDQTKLRNVMIPGTKIMMPMNTSAAFIFKAIPELIYNTVTREGTENELDRRRVRKALADAARDMLLGPEPVPAGAKPIIEVLLDRNFYTGRTVIPEGLKDVAAAEQYTSSTSELGKALSALMSIPGTDDKRILSPIEADHLVRGIFGSAGAMAQWASNSIGVIAETRPEPTARETPVIGGFLREDIPRGREDLFYDFKKEVFEKYKTYKNMIDQEDFDAADAYQDKHGDVAAMYQYINETEASLGEINSEIRRIALTRSKDMTPKERREEIDELRRIKLEILEPVKELRREVFR